MLLSSFQRASAPTVASGSSMTCSWRGACCVDACTPARKDRMHVPVKKMMKATTFAASLDAASRCSTSQTESLWIRSTTRIPCASCPATMLLLFLLGQVVQHLLLLLLHRRPAKKGCCQLQVLLHLLQLPLARKRALQQQLLLPSPTQKIPQPSTSTAPHLLPLVQQRQQQLLAAASTRRTDTGPGYTTGCKSTTATMVVHNSISRH